MKALLINGSPHEHGCTYTALSEAAEAIKSEGVGADIFQIGTAPIGGCIACGGCAKAGKCVFDDKVNEFVALAEDYDGFIFGSPVYYASANGALSAFMDRAFYSAGNSHNKCFIRKPAAAVCSARRAGTTATLDQLHKYFYLAQMPIVTSFYWNEVHGSSPEQVKEDLEGMQCMRQLGRNMAWMLKTIEAGRAAGIPEPAREKRAMTNFIR